MLKPIDVMVLGWLLSREAPGDSTQQEIAAGLGISQSAVSRALKQLQRSGLCAGAAPRVSAAQELFVHGARYVYPPTLGPPTRGLPTAHSAPPLQARLVSDSILVWPTEDAHRFGPSLEPIHPAVPAAALRDPAFYEVMVLLDALRVGRARERKVAQTLLRQRLRR